MKLSTTCRQCGREYVPDDAAIRAGTWQLCAACRQKPQERPREAVRKETPPDA